MERFYSIPTKDVHGKKAIISACQKSRRGSPPKQEDSSTVFVYRVWVFLVVSFSGHLLMESFFAFCGKLLCYTPNTVFMVCSIKDRIACWLYPCLLVNAQIVDEQWLKGHHICGKWLFLHLTEGISHTHPLLVHGNAAHYRILCNLFKIQSNHRVFIIFAGTSA